jgi:magnesium chelatase subunit D
MTIYPFAAIAGQPELKLALMLSGVDWRLSVLLKGDKGSGKSTAARALAGILPGNAPFVNLPIGTTEDRLLGGLDLSQALQGEARLKRGLIHQAHGGVLYVDEINLLADSLTDALLDVASSGRQQVERDGLSASDDAEFIFLGSMNVEEGTLRPQLMDRFALSVEVRAPRRAEDRARIVDARFRFDADPVEFCRAFQAEQQTLRDSIAQARLLLREITPSAGVLLAIAEAVSQAGVHSLRADLAVLRAAIAHAALDRRVEVTGEDIAAVLPLVLHDRAKSAPEKQPSKGPREQPGESQENFGERIFTPEKSEAPVVRRSVAEPVMRGRTAPGESNEKLDVVASFTQSFRNTGSASLQSDQLVFRAPAAKSGVRFIFVVDASGSHAARQRMRAVKGAAAALLESSVDHKDEVAVIAFRGAKAEIVLEPCRDAEAANRLLEFLPTGGRTPLAHALELAGSLVTGASLLILITDGRANVPLTGGDPWTDALEAARKLRCPAVVVDSSLDGSSAAATTALASAMDARRIPLDELNQEAWVSLLRV